MGILQNIGENDLITLPPGYCILEILAFFIRIFISIMPGSHLEFIEGINLMKVYRTSSPYNYGKSDNKHYLHLQACSYKMFYESSILSYASPKTLRKQGNSKGGSYHVPSGSH